MFVYDLDTIIEAAVIFGYSDAQITNAIKSVYVLPDSFYPYVKDRVIATEAAIERQVQNKNMMVGIVSYLKD